MLWSNFKNDILCFGVAKSYLNILEISGNYVVIQLLFHIQGDNFKWATIGTSQTIQLLTLKFKWGTSPYFT